MYFLIKILTIDANILVLDVANIVFIYFSSNSLNMRIRKKKRWSLNMTKFIVY